MPVAISIPLDPPPPPQPPRKRWTRAECSALEATGVWDCKNLELIDGELIDRMGKKQPHNYAVSCIVRWLVGVFAAPSQLLLVGDVLV